jgi:tubulin-tyrosine ligase family protein
VLDACELAKPNPENVQDSWPGLTGLVHADGTAGDSSAPIPASELLRTSASLPEDLRTACAAALGEVAAALPYFSMNGSHNLWIVKPAGLSRGRGIEVFDSLDAIKVGNVCARRGGWSVMGL